MLKKMVHGDFYLLSERFFTKNWSFYIPVLKNRASLMVWFDPSMVWDGLATGRWGALQRYSDAAAQTCVTLKVLFDFA